MKPSQVFFGEILRSGVRPRANPVRYAMTSLEMTRLTGRMNQMNPRKMEATKKDVCVTMNPTIMHVQPYCENWYIIHPFFSRSTNPTRPAT